MSVWKSMVRCLVAGVNFFARSGGPTRVRPAQRPRSHTPRGPPQGHRHAHCFDMAKKEFICPHPLVTFRFGALCGTCTAVVPTSRGLVSPGLPCLTTHAWSNSEGGSSGESSDRAAGARELGQLGDCLCLQRMNGRMLMFGGALDLAQARLCAAEWSPRCRCGCSACVVRDQECSCSLCNTLRIPCPTFSCHWYHY